MRTISQELLSFLQEVDLKLDTLRDRMEQMEHLDLQVNMNTWNTPVCDTQLVRLDSLTL